MNITLSEKMNRFPTLIFSELSNYKNQRMQEGHDIVDLSIGSPDLPPPQFVMDALAKQVQDPTQYGYTLTGLEELHQAIAEYYERHYDVPLQEKDEVLMVMGSQDGLVHLPMVLTNPEDIILVPDPGYTAYEAGVSLAGATTYKMPLKEENEFLPDLEAIPEEIRAKAKMMILNFPGNPVPSMATKEFFEKVVAFAKQNEVVVLHDFAYSELYFEDEKPISFLSVEGAKEVGVEFNSLSKSFNMAGCRIGYVVGNPTVVQALDQLKSNLDYGVFRPIQNAAIQALNNSSTFSEELRNVYRRRRDVFVQGLHEIGWEVESPKASMFIFAKVPLNMNSLDFAYNLIDEAGIVVTPGSAFGAEGEGYVRIAITQNENVLIKAVNKLQESGVISPIKK
ncbi:LL-diaminopimelate aminotransferase [Salinibacillus xinjiangensis]|uniref:Aminotransferase n=1 Tax=Salinibacillus xinjiangensis TaxID=1229268 RepID=A0A6G1XA54_9BACI|nr:LL-diaminopimelate aminotransferase [Salinibacillus xinjiangensis]MRG87809.1 LL-diaminopimelate aminotransferase [Salinibacillus xinjiangensis]